MTSGGRSADGLQHLHSFPQSTVLLLQFAYQSRLGVDAGECGQRHALEYCGEEVVHRNH